MLRALLAAMILLSLPSTAAAMPLSTHGRRSSTDEQRLAVYLHTAESYFPAAANCTSRRVHLHADAEIDAVYHGDQAVEGMATLGGQPGYTGPCDVWLRSELTAHNFYVDIFHEMAHTAGWQDGPEMDSVVNGALDKVASQRRPPAARARIRPNRHQGKARLPRSWH